MTITESGGVIYNEGGATKYLSKKELTDPIVESVKNKLSERSLVGMLKYKEHLGNHKKYNFIQEMQNEALDFANYCEVILQKEETINQLIDKYPNYHELGEAISKIYGK